MNPLCFVFLEANQRSRFFTYLSGFLTLYMALRDFILESTWWGTELNTLTGFYFAYGAHEWLFDIMKPIIKQHRQQPEADKLQLTSYLVLETGLQNRLPPTFLLSTRDWQDDGKGSVKKVWQERQKDSKAWENQPGVVISIRRTVLCPLFDWAWQSKHVCVRVAEGLNGT